MLKCSYCSKRGSRFCPAKKVELCPQCCGRLRRVTIQCLEECEYLLESRRQALKKLLAVYGNSDFEMKWFELLHNLRFTLVDIRRRSSGDLTNDDVIQALESLVEIKRIQQKGLIYTPKLVNHKVQMLVAAMERVMAYYEKPLGTNAGRLSLEQLNSCLTYLLRQVRELQRRGVDFIQLLSAVVGMKLINIKTTASTSVDRFQ